MASNSVKTYKVTCTNANTAYNVLTGTTSAPTIVPVAADKGRGITFQCQTNGAKGFAGGSDVSSNAGVVFLGPDGAYSPAVSPTSSGYQAQDWWVSSDTAGAVIVVQLVKHV